ncbi:hypothetical protein BESEP5_00199 [Staphylococcus phage vB_SepM_BE05]|nr:hypothetical protein BESEP5_00199 [Staphylococcus phage vB_SepM_BE05]
MNNYKEYIADTYERVKKQGVITTDALQWKDAQECDDLLYKINISCLYLYGVRVKEISTTPKCVKLILNNNTKKFIKKGA